MNMHSSSTHNAVCIAMTTAAFIVSAGVSAFSPLANTRTTGVSKLEAASPTLDTRTVYDPFGLYPANSEERANGRLQALEPPITMNTAPVLDPLGLYAASAGSAAAAAAPPLLDMSDALPFLPRPVLLDRTMAGDVGFDPFQFAGDSRDGAAASNLYMMREAELKHGRIAMLAAVGWPVSEVLHPALAAHAFHLPAILGHADRVPSLLNGGLELVSPVFWATVLGLAGGLEAWLTLSKDESVKNPALAGDYGFDPFGLYPKDDGTDGRKRMQLAEIKNGRLAMMAITGFAYQEVFTNMAVVHQIPFLHF